MVADWPIAPYEDVLQIVEGHEKIAIAPCICRKTRKLADHDCDKPLENCFSFGSNADYYVEKGLGRYITRHYGATVRSYNISHEQVAYARKKPNRSSSIMKKPAW